MFLTSMNTVLGDILNSVEARRWYSTEEALCRLASLYDAATASMRYAAEFSSDTYRDVVRPSMMPPSMPPGFSGTLNREHRLMVTLLRRLAPKMRTARAGTGASDIPSEVLDAWSSVRAARRRNQESHGLVCGQFVPDGVSLLQEFHKKARRTATLEVQ